MRTPVVLLLLLVGAWTASFLALLARDEIVDYGNPAEHLVNALLVHDRLAGDLPPVPSGAWVYEPDAYYPPVPMLSGAAGVALGGRREPAAIVATQAFWALVLAGSVWALVRRFAEPWAAAAGAATALLAPGVAMYSRWYYPDLALAAVVALTWAAALYAGDLGRPGGAVWLGLAVGLGMLTKWTYPVYVAPLLAWTAWRALRAGHAWRLLLFAGLALGVSVPFYLQGGETPLWRQLLDLLPKTHAAHAAHPIDPEPIQVPLLGSVRSVRLWHLQELGMVLLWVPVSLLALAGAVTTWRRFGAEGRILVLSGGVALAVASSIAVQQNRYTLPLVGLAAVLAALWAAEGRTWRRWALAAAVAPTALTMFSWPLPASALPSWALPCPTPHAGHPGPLHVQALREEGSHVRELAREIALQQAALGREVRLVVACESAWSWSLRYWLAVERVPWVCLEVRSLEDLSAGRRVWQPGFRLSQALPPPGLEQCDYLVLDNKLKPLPEGRLVATRKRGSLDWPAPLADLGSFAMGDAWGTYLRLVRVGPRDLGEVPPEGG